MTLAKLEADEEFKVEKRGLVRRRHFCPSHEITRRRCLQPITSQGQVASKSL